jgi:hypothetical protein
VANRVGGRGGVEEVATMVECEKYSKHIIHHAITGMN